MKRLIDKILDRLEEARNDMACMDDEDYFLGKANAFANAKAIVQEVAKGYDWIPVETELPKEDEWVLCYGINAFGSKKYEVSTYSHRLEHWMCRMLVDVIAWQRIAPYQKGE